MKTLKTVEEFKNAEPGVYRVEGKATVELANQVCKQYTEVEVEFMLSWARENPQLFEERFNKFFDDYAKDYAITSKARKGYIVLHAKRK